MINPMRSYINKGRVEHKDLTFLYCLSYYMNKCVWCVFGVEIPVRSVVARYNVGYLYTCVCVVALKASVCVCVCVVA